MHNKPAGANCWYLVIFAKVTGNRRSAGTLDVKSSVEFLARIDWIKCFNLFRGVQNYDILRLNLLLSFCGSIMLSIKRVLFNNIQVRILTQAS